MHYAVERQVLLDLAKELEALAAHRTRRVSAGNA